MKRVCFFLLILFIQGISISLAQNIVFKGKVKDSLNEPLSYVNLIAKPVSIDQNMTFAISDENGRYSLVLKKNSQYTITASMMGFETENFELTPTENVTKDIVLFEAKNQLDEVTIELPVIVKRDTIIYNADKFVNGNERKLKNVLKKLPGVEVNKDGEVTVQGKKVTTLLVDGKKFFGGGTKLGVENIPADAVDKVEVIDNYNEVAFLKDLTDSEDMAMNIQLKEDKKRFVFGDIEAGKGNEDYYKSNANLFYYTPKTNVNFIGNLNNIGEKTFTFKDYLNFQGGVNAAFSENFNWRGGDFSQFLQNKDVLGSGQRFGAINITKTTSDKLDISGYAIFSHNNTRSFQETLNNYTEFTENKEAQGNVKDVLGIGKLNLEYAPNNNEQFYVRSQVKRSTRYGTSSILSSIDSQVNSIFSDRSLGAWNVNQNIEWHKKQSKKHTFSAVANYIFDSNNPTTMWDASQSFAQTIQTIINPVDVNQNQLRLQQIKEKKQHYLYTVFKDFWVLNRNNHIYTTLGNTHQQEKFISNDSQILDDSSVNNFTSGGFNNNTVLKFNDFFAGVHYKFRTGIFTFKQGVFLHNYNWEVTQSNSLVRKNKWVVLPDVFVNIEFNKSKKLKFNYNLKTNFSDISKLANRFYLQSYNSVFKGNENLENELFHSARLFYSRFSLYRGLMLHASANYTKKVKGFRSTVDFDGVNRFVSVNLFDNPDENWGLRGSLRKKIKKMRYKVEGSYRNSTFIQQVNNAFTNNVNKNYSYTLSAETLFDKLPRIEFGYKQSIGDYRSGITNSKFITNEPFVDLEYTFLKDFTLKGNYNYYDYKNKTLGQQNNYSIANASLFYQKEDSPWNFKITAQNILNETFKQSNQFSDYFISDTRTFIMPRVVLLSVGYKL
ncbi:CarboxypepD_reg-like domain-containing protein [Tenacibaculum sp. MAR_2009_124]|uniref:carboxypeptidase-like regulatory domain-containing protein n=1 Tax=Tenacibaculum sp. MAR_2009_124 TaxID=1250059 RepID=UPI0008977ED9|nr:carboxypeptidase-like regulatory domain-containing protein [Tenacibaculum sp. MAR_2009_124]SEC54177.1 CarboxypepD_reg-like domain-containing protein [Tenacibaculum sp. MAR_2009_124]